MTFKMGQTKLSPKQEDFLIENGRDKDYTKKDEICSQNALECKYEPSKDEFDDGMFMCAYCGGIFDENDLDKCDGDWICRKCEEDLK